MKGGNYPLKVLHIMTALSEFSWLGSFPLSLYFNHPARCSSGNCQGLYSSLYADSLLPRRLLKTYRFYQRPLRPALPPCTLWTRLMSCQGNSGLHFLLPSYPGEREEKKGRKSHPCQVLAQIVNNSKTVSKEGCSAWQEPSASGCLLVLCWSGSHSNHFNCFQ